ncbi:sugar transferase [Mariniflexile sp. AS56]|uniref:sugar transferase n=1 Tax=Mariniflexile sp. AS56 TaxID=3063957 RepID=UPI0026EDC638|nr:sugar transferase [Mariniflexile sp. AS56]MDO7171353.1 sugar transferase [Mariniflexile sp. AS56]
MYKHFFKRILDIAFAFIALIILSPIFLILSLALFFLNKDTPFYFQQRPGKNEKIFKIIKFKSMTDKKGPDGKLLPDEERVTRFGDFIRKYSLDEIPQLLNILSGDMSLIGPRPLRVQYLPYYTETEKIRHTIRPGVTGWAQVSGRNSLGWDEKLALDVEYVEKMNWLLDFKIFFKTIKKVFNASDVNINETIIDLNDHRNNVQNN